MEFIEFEGFTKEIDKIASQEEQIALHKELIKNPEKGSLIQGTNGARKIRMSLQGRGKSGGARVVYYFQISKDVILFLHAYLKKDKDNITSSEKKEIASLIKEIKL